MAEAEERKLHFHREKLSSEEDWLRFLVSSMREDNEQIAFYISKAKESYWNYEQLGTENSLDIAEQFAALAQTAKANRHTIKDVRQQRERVQWQRQKVNQMARKLGVDDTENKTS